MSRVFHGWEIAEIIRKEEWRMGVGVGLTCGRKAERLGSNLISRYLFYGLHTPEVICVFPSPKKSQKVCSCWGQGACCLGWVNSRSQRQYFFCSTWYVWSSTLPWISLPVDFHIVLALFWLSIFFIGMPSSVFFIVPLISSTIRHQRTTKFNTRSLSLSVLRQFYPIDVYPRFIHGFITVDP